MPGRLEPEPLPRRDFLGLAGLWSAAIAVFGSIIGMARLPVPSVLPEVGSRFRIGAPGDFPPGTERVIPDRNVLVIGGEDGVAAMSLICTHLGCVSKKKDRGFACPCHGSVFGADGAVEGGPAPRGLRWVEVSLGADGSLVVDSQREVPKGTYFKV
jgi:cytochrome b6-f complex iron-sulfur subunit